MTGMPAWPYSNVFEDTDDPTPGSDFFGGRFGSSCQSLGGIYTNTVFWSHFRFRERIMAFTACESEQKPCGSEACVDHLHNVKLSFVWLMVLVCIFYILNHVCRRHRCDSGSCADEDGQKSQWYQRETSLNVPASNFIFHFNFLQWDKPRTTKPVSCIRTFLRALFPNVFKPLYGFRNLNYCPVIQFLVSDFRGLFVHARCIPY